jgi:hypothetical protein
MHSFPKRPTLAATEELFNTTDFDPKRPTLAATEELFNTTDFDPKRPTLAATEELFNTTDFDIHSFPKRPAQAAIQQKATTEELSNTTVTELTAETW